MRRTLFIGPLLAVTLWSILSYGGFVRPVFLPAPHTVISRLLYALFTGEILPDIVATIFRLFVGFAFGATLGVPVGLLMGYYKKIYDSLESLVDFCRSVPVTSLFPLFLLFFGIGDIAKIAMAVWSSMLIILINTMYGVRHANELHRRVAIIMKANSVQVFRFVVFPDAMPNIIVGCRTGISLALIVIVVAEMFMGTREGLGQIIYNSSLLYDTNTMYAAILLTGIIGYAVNKLLLSIEHRVIHWSGKA